MPARQSIALFLLQNQTASTASTLRIRAKLRKNFISFAALDKPLRICYIHLVSQFEELYDHIIKSVREYEAKVKDKEEARAKMLPVRLKAYIIRNKLTQESLANDLGVSRMELFRWLRGEYVPRDEVMRKLEERKIIDKIE